MLDYTDDGTVKGHQSSQPAPCVVICSLISARRPPAGHPEQPVRGSDGLPDGRPPDPPTGPAHRHPHGAVRRILGPGREIL